MGLLKYLGSGDEDETPRDGFLSSFAEWHSISIGISIGFITALSGGKDAAWMMIAFGTIALGVREVNIGHLKDVQKEPMYGLVGAIVAFIITAFVIIPRIPEIAFN